MIYLTDEARETALANIQRLHILLAEKGASRLGTQETKDLLHYLGVLMDAIKNEQRGVDKRRLMARRN